MPVDYNRAIATEIALAHNIELPYALPPFRVVEPAPDHFFPGRVYNRGKPNELPASILHAVIHNTEGDDSLEWLSTSPASAWAASCHCLVTRDGTLIYIVKPSDTAFHVGYAKPPYNNSNSVGLEFENRSTRRLARMQSYPIKQVYAGAYWLATMTYSFGIPWSRVARHGDIATNPVGRRTDPSYFDMIFFKRAWEAWSRALHKIPQEHHPLFFI